MNSADNPGSGAVRPKYPNLLQYQAKITYDDHFEEEQAQLKAEFLKEVKQGEHVAWRKYHKLTCYHCKKEYFYHGAYGKSFRRRYCSSKCANSAYVARRKANLLAIRMNRICLFCNKKFVAKRIDAKYCCDNHRVRALYARGKKHSE